MQKISDYELELMKIIWANNGTALYAEIIKGLEAKGNAWTKNTTLTLLSRLTDKGMLKTSKTGRRNIYTALIAESEYQADQTVRFIDKVYEGNIEGLISALIANNLFSQSDYDELKKRWDL